MSNKSDVIMRLVELPPFRRGHQSGDMDWELVNPTPFDIGKELELAADRFHDALGGSVKDLLIYTCSDGWICVSWTDDDGEDHEEVWEFQEVDA